MIRTVLAILLLAFTSIAQEPFQPLATMSGRSFTAQDIPYELGNAWQKLPSTLTKAKKDLLELQVDNLLLSNEAKKRGISLDELIAAEIDAKVTEPAKEKVESTYEANKAELGFIGLERAREPVTEYLKSEQRKQLRSGLIAELRKTAKIEYPASITKPKVLLNEQVAVVDGVAITYAAYRTKNALALYEYEANVFDEVYAAVKMLVDSAVYQEEATSRGIPANRLIQEEVTSKMKDFSAEEQARLENQLLTKLYAKFRVKYFIEAPKIFVQNVSADDDPILGAKNAPVTVVVFADFQCPTCAALNPVIKEIVNKNTGNVRLVYRDFPLESIHDNAFQAARAAHAAHKQGKFYAYSDRLYDNQNALDRESLIKYAEELKLDKTKFVADMDSAVTEAEVRNDMADAERYGVAGTPSIFVNGYKIRKLSVGAIEEAVRKALAKEF